MSKKFSHLISWGSLATILLMTTVLLTLLIKIDWFTQLVQTNLRLPIQWATVKQWQWFLLWGSTATFLSIGLFGLYFLHCAFKKISSGELFNLVNSLNIRRFAILLFVQTAAKPIYFSLTSIILSFNHPTGQKMLSVSFGSQEITMLALAMIFWVVSDVLVAGCKLQAENRQFI